MMLTPLVPGFIVIGNAGGGTVTAIPEQDRERWLAGFPVPAFRMSLPGLVDPVDTLSELELRDLVRRVRDEMYRDSSGRLTPDVDAGADQLALVYQALDGSGLCPPSTAQATYDLWSVRLMDNGRHEHHVVMADDAVMALAVARRGGALLVQVEGPIEEGADTSSVAIRRLPADMAGRLMAVS